MPTTCQSCGMPMSEKSHFGSEHDGSTSPEFCTFCYQNGRFLDEGITVQDKIRNNVQIAVKMGLSEQDAQELAANTIPTLKRWSHS